MKTLLQGLLRRNRKGKKMEKRKNKAERSRSEEGTEKKGQRGETAGPLGTHCGLSVDTSNQHNPHGPGEGH